MIFPDDWYEEEYSTITENRSKWDNRFMDLAKHIATWSKDPSTQVGAIIVDDHKKVIGMGYNGFPRGIKDTEERLNDRPTKYSLVVHAELNAILNAKLDSPVSFVHNTLYCTLFPCSECAKAIIQAGIKTVVAPDWRVGNDDRGERWADAHLLSEKMFGEAGLGVRYV